MSSIFAIEMKIAAAEDTLDAADMRCNAAEYEALEAEKQRAEASQVLQDLKIELQEAEALAAAARAAAAAAAERPVGTKYKWTHQTNRGTYRVAIQTKKGVLQVKSAIDGVVEVHERGCHCAPCWEFHHDAPWRLKKPLKQQMFADITAWDETLPMNQGKLVITSAPITSKDLKALCMKPLEPVGDALMLKELEERFPGGVFVLNTPKERYEISYKRVAGTYDQIYCARINMSFMNFSDYCGHDKITLIVDWQGFCIDLSHLFWEGNVE